MHSGRDDSQWHAFYHRRSTKYNLACMSWRWHTLQEERPTRCNNCNRLCLIFEARVVKYSMWHGNKSSSQSKQLVELQNLDSSGVVFDDEDKMEKEHIVNQLWQLKSNRVSLYVKIV